MIAKRVLYSGRVQGVGFRYTANELARGHAVAGYVRNLPNGQVELIAEGAPEEVDAFLDAISRRMQGYIAEQTIVDVPTTGFADFGIRL